MTGHTPIEMCISLSDEYDQLKQEIKRKEIAMSAIMKSLVDYVRQLEGVVSCDLLRKAVEEESQSDSTAYTLVSQQVAKTFFGHSIAASLKHVTPLGTPLSGCVFKFSVRCIEYSQAAYVNIYMPVFDAITLSNIISKGKYSATFSYDGKKWKRIAESYNADEIKRAIETAVHMPPFTPV